MTIPKYTSKHWLTGVIAFLLLFLSASTVQAQEVIIDNGSPGTSFTGTWAASSAAGYYGANSLWSRSGATYTWHANLTQSGSYQVYMWWSQDAARSTSAPVTITYSIGSRTVNVNQTVNGGKWNLLGTYPFVSSSGGTVKITAVNGAPTTYCADSVRFVRVGNTAPVASIVSIAPNPAQLGAQVDLTGTGTDPDGSVTAYNWRSSINGNLGTTAVLQKSTLAIGAHTIYFKVQDNSGAWSPEVPKALSITKASAPPVASIVSITPSPAQFGDNVTLTGSGTDSDGSVVAYNWRSSLDGNLGTTAVLQTSSLTAGNHTIYFKVQDNLGGWSVEVSQVLSVTRVNVPPVASITSLAPTPAPSGANVTLTGTGTDPDGDVTAYNWRSNIDGDLGTTAVVQKNTLAIGTHTIFLKVQDDSGAWSPEMSQELSVTQNVPPVASIMSLSPNPVKFGTEVTLAGSGTDSDGSIAAYNWRSNLDGDLGTVNVLRNNTLTAGTHAIYFKVQDSSGEWSPEISQALSVTPNALPVATIESISPNPVKSGDEVTLTGSGTDSDGIVTTYNWRSSIDGDLGTTDILRKNALTTGTHAIYFKVQDDSGEWSAEVSNELRVTPNDLPVASIVSIFPSPAQAGTLVTLTGSGTDPDGSITAFSWRSNIDGNLGTTAVLQMNTLKAGTHTIYFKVQDNKGAWSPEVSQELTVVLPTVIIDNGETGTSFTGTWAATTSSGFYGPNALWGRDGATYTWHADLPQSGLYDVYMWWVQYSSRSTNAAVTITYGDSSRNVYINQQINGGKWNLLGTFAFDPSSGGTVRITAVNGAPVSYCADSVKFSPSSGINTPPTAAITSITPNPAAIGTAVTFTGSGSDPDGTVTGYSWRSTIDGVLGTSAVIQKSTLTPGQHSIFYKVQDNKGEWSTEVEQGLLIGTNNVEHVFYFSGYGETNTEPPAAQMLANLKATKVGSKWIYKNIAQNKTYYIYFIKTIDSMQQALMTEGAHIIYAGHANYGLGGVFSTTTEHNNQRIDALYTIDDERIFNYSSKWISVGLHGIRTEQAYPNFWPVFRDGTNGIMPYKFSDPRGAPPYNYYLSYRVPGDPTHYKIETVRNSSIERFFTSNVPAWSSSTGTTPNPSNTNDKKYFVTNTASWSPSIQITGSWAQMTQRAGFYNENYQQASAGSGDANFTWLFSIPTAGNYKIYAWWPAYSDRATTAPYTINASGGAATVTVNQRLNGNQWNELGEFTFDKGDYSVSLSNNVSSGYVVADAVRVSHVDNPPEVIQSDFRASPLYGTAPLDVEFINQGVAYTDRHWYFGDGLENGTRDDIIHTYTAPGIYTASLDVSNSLGTSNRTKESYVYVAEGALQTRAEFSASPQVANIPAVISFKDRSSGNIISWAWDFGDGATSTQRLPSHTYTTPGNYTVTLTVKDSTGNISTETKPNFVRAVVYEKNIDNVDYPLNHYGSRTILFRGDPEIQEDELRYSRMFYCACNSGNYFLDTFHRGIMFYSLNTSNDMDGVHYLEAYLKGNSDYQIWQILQSYNPVYDYYNFNKVPTEQ